MFSKVMHLVLYFHLGKVMSFDLINMYLVLGIFKGHAIHIIVLRQTSRYGLVFCYFIHVLGIRYFQMSCTLYHRCMPYI